MIYPIVKFGDPVLEKPAAPVTAFDEELKKLVADMFESMYEAHGVGLAAPQIGHVAQPAQGHEAKRVHPRVGRRVGARLERRGRLPGLLDEDDRVDREEDREGDRPAIEVALDERAAAQRPLPGADAEGAREPRVLPRVHEDEEDQDDRDDDLQEGQDREDHGVSLVVPSRAVGPRAGG